MSERATIVIDAPVEMSNQVARIIDGEVVWTEITPEEQKAYTFKADGIYELEITGVYDPWTQRKPDKYIKPGENEMQTLTRLEFEILSGKGKGARFASRVGVSLGTRSNLIKVWKATVGPTGERPDLTELLGKQLKMYVAKNDVVNETTGVVTTYANPEWATAKPLGAANNDDGWEE